jgi:hypothetical protein
VGERFGKVRAESRQERVRVALRSVRLLVERCGVRDASALDNIMFIASDR